MPLNPFDAIVDSSGDACELSTGDAAIVDPTGAAACLCGTACDILFQATACNSGDPCTHTPIIYVCDDAIVIDPVTGVLRGVLHGDVIIVGGACFHATSLGIYLRCTGGRLPNPGQLCLPDGAVTVTGTTQNPLGVVRTCGDCPPRACYLLGSRCTGSPLPDPPNLRVLFTLADILLWRGNGGTCPVVSLGGACWYADLTNDTVEYDPDTDVLADYGAFFNTCCECAFATRPEECVTGCPGPLVPNSDGDYVCAPFTAIYDGTQDYYGSPSSFNVGDPGECCCGTPRRVNVDTLLIVNDRYNGDNYRRRALGYYSTAGSDLTITEEYPLLPSTTTTHITAAYCPCSPFLDNGGAFYTAGGLPGYTTFQAWAAGTLSVSCTTAAWDIRGYDGNPNDPDNPPIITTHATGICTLVPNNGACYGDCGPSPIVGSGDGTNSGGAGVAGCGGCGTTLIESLETTPI